MHSLRDKSCRARLHGNNIIRWNFTTIYIENVHKKCDHIFVTKTANLSTHFSSVAFLNCRSFPGFKNCGFNLRSCTIFIMNSTELQLFELYTNPFGEFQQLWFTKKKSCVLKYGRGHESKTFLKRRNTTTEFNMRRDGFTTGHYKSTRCTNKIPSRRRAVKNARWHAPRGRRGAFHLAPENPPFSVSDRPKRVN